MTEKTEKKSDDSAVTITIGPVFFIAGSAVNMAIAMFGFVVGGYESWVPWASVAIGINAAWCATLDPVTITFGSGGKR